MRKIYDANFKILKSSPQLWRRNAKLSQKGPEFVYYVPTVIGILEGNSSVR